MERKAGLFIAEGMWLVRRLLQSSLPVESLLVDQQRLVEIGVPLPPHVPVYIAPNGFTEQVVGFNFHRGVIACGRRPASLALTNFSELDEPEWIMLVAAEVQDPENVGAMMRNAAAFGARGMILGKHCSDPYSRRALRVSMGAPFYLPIAECAELLAALTWLRESYGATIATTVLDPSAQPLEQTSRPRRLALVFGSEGHGLGEEWNSFADLRLTIPMAPGADSLNVAVASAVCLHYFTRIAAPAI